MLYLSSTIIAILCFFFGTDILQNSHWNPNLLLKCFVNHAKYMLFMTNEKERIILSPGQDLSATEIALAILYGASNFYRRLVGFYENILTAVGPLTLWITVKEFMNFLLKENEPFNAGEKWFVVNAKFNVLRDLTDIVNDTFGPLFILHFVTGFFFYSNNLDKLITSPDWFIRFKFAAYYAIFIVTLVLSSDICRQVGFIIYKACANTQILYLVR